MAVIAGLPKAPSTFNPLYSMDRATARRNVVLSRMLSENYITQAQYDQARSEAIDANYHAPEIAFSAPYLSEMVRQKCIAVMVKKPMKTGIASPPPLRVKSNRRPSRRSVITSWITTCATATVARQTCYGKWAKAPGTPKITDSLKALPTYGPLLPAVVTNANPQEATATLADGTSVALRMEGMRWARPYRSDTQQGPTPRKVTDVVQTGQQIWVRQSVTPGGWHRFLTSTPRWSPSIRKTAR